MMCTFVLSLSKLHFTRFKRFYFYTRSPCWRNLRKVKALNNGIRNLVPTNEATLSNGNISPPSYEFRTEWGEGRNEMDEWSRGRRMHHGMHGLAPTRAVRPFNSVRKKKTIYAQQTFCTMNALCLKQTHVTRS